ncbi:amino acid ABC transporter substrate-binding protein, partial [Alphaproteobacteria bacterium]|nr:amino acid ABC transporter substrate-binding protein [Alphaproteobacteria bacterium]
MSLFKKFFSIFAIISFVVSLGLPAQAKVEGDTIILGAAVSLTGKYSTNGEHTQNGYNMAVQRINDMGG